MIIVGPGTGTVVNKTAIKQYQQATRDRSKVKTEGGKIIRVEAHPIPEHPRPNRAKGRVTLVGDAAGYVTKCSGEGIYFAAKSGRMAAEAIVEDSLQGKPLHPLFWTNVKWYCVIMDASHAFCQDDGSCLLLC